MNQDADGFDVAIPRWFRIVGITLLVWNLIGLAVFAMHISVAGDQEALENLQMTEEQQKLIMETPTWVNVAFGVAVVAGVLGCIALVMRSRMAVPVLGLSLLGVVAQNVYVYFMSNSLEVMGPGLSPVVIVVAIALVPFAMYCAKQKWY